MKSATELLAEILAIYEDPDRSVPQLYLWLHQSVGEIRAVIENDIEPEPCLCVDPDCPLFHRNSYTNPSQEQLKGWIEDGARLDWLEAAADEMIELSGSRAQLYWGEHYGHNYETDPGSLRGAIDRARGEGES